MPQPLLFPLNRLGVADVTALQFALRAKPLLQPAFMQQRMKAYQDSLAPKAPVNRPWNVASSRFGITDVQTLVPSVVHQLLPYPPTNFKISGITKDSTGAVLASCTVDLFITSTNILFGTATSDANGYYQFLGIGQPPTAFYIVAYKAGSPDVAGTTVNTLVGA
jgi:hypothetical protein